MADQLTSSAEVSTDAADRYTKQLASHLGRKAEVRTEPEGERIVLGPGSCLLVPGPSSLELLATRGPRLHGGRVPRPGGGDRGVRPERLVFSGSRMDVSQTLETGEPAALTGATIGFASRSVNLDACQRAVVQHPPRARAPARSPAR